MNVIAPEQVVTALLKHNLYPAQGIWVDNAKVKKQGWKDYKEVCRVCGLAALFINKECDKSCQVLEWAKPGQKLEWAKSKLRFLCKEYKLDNGIHRIGMDLGLSPGYSYGFVLGWDWSFSIPWSISTSWSIFLGEEQYLSGYEAGKQSWIICNKECAKENQ